MPGGTLLIEVEGLVKRYGRAAALDGVDLRVPDGGVTALLGENGAGKSTLLRCVATLERPTSGAVRVGGRSVARHGAAVRRRVGYVGHRGHLYDGLTAAENLRFYGGLYGLTGARLDARVGELLESVGLAHRAGDAAGHLSRGQRQRLAVARALVHDPQVLLLDEPFTGLDAASARALEARLRRLAGEGRAVLLATHRVGRAVAAADRVAVLRAGRVAHEEAVAGDRDAVGARLERVLAAPGGGP